MLCLDEQIWSSEVSGVHYSVLSWLILRLAKILLNVGGRICWWGLTGHTHWGNLAAPVLARVLEGLGRQAPHMLDVDLFVAMVAAEKAAKQLGWSLFSLPDCSQPRLTP